LHLPAAGLTFVSTKVSKTSVVQNSLPNGIQPSPCMAQAFSRQAALLLEIPASPMAQTVVPLHPCKDVEH
jgi:hypothetical protein